MTINHSLVWELFGIALLWVFFLGGAWGVIWAVFSFGFGGGGGVKHSFVPFPQQGEGESSQPHNPEHSSSNSGAKKKFHSFHRMKIRLSIDHAPMDKVWIRDEKI